MKPDEYLDLKFLKNSRTYTEIAEEAIGMPIDTNNKASLESALTIAACGLIKAVDAGDIQFTTIEARNLCLGLITVGLDVVLNGALLKRREIFDRYFAR